MLEKHKALPCRLDVKLDGKAKGLKLSFLRDHFDLGSSGTKPVEFKNVTLQVGEQRVLGVDLRLPAEGAAELYKDVKPGDVLVGKYNLTSHAELARPVVYVLPPAAPKDDDKVDDPKDKPTLAALSVEMAAKIDDVDERIRFLETLSAGADDELALLVARMEAVEALKEPAHDRVVKAADAVLARIDEDKLAQDCGTKAASDTVEQRRQQKDVDKRKVRRASS